MNENNNPYTVEEKSVFFSTVKEAKDIDSNRAEPLGIEFSGLMYGEDGCYFVPANQIESVVKKAKIDIDQSAPFVCIEDYNDLTAEDMEKMWEFCIYHDSEKYIYMVPADFWNEKVRLTIQLL